MSSRLRRSTLLAFVLALSLGWGLSLIASAQQSKPIITTPTPSPVPGGPARPPIPPEAIAQGRVAFLPFITTGGTARAQAGPQSQLQSEVQDANPASFTYVVKPGDTLWLLALDFGRDLNTMSCTTRPTGSDAETLVAGATITVPALSDLCYTVMPGDTLAAIAARHGLPVQAIVAVPWNGFASPPYSVVPRQRILLPGARRAAVPRPDRQSVSKPSDLWANSPWPEWRYGDEHFIWPVVGPVSQGAHAGHWALDIAVPAGTPVQAADRGTVVVAGWNPTGYGFRVVIDHGNDYVTLYAHLNDIYVEPKQVVGKGQVIGVVGANGNITGPHLHFEIRDFGMLTDPARLLPH